MLFDEHLTKASWIPKEKSITPCVFKLLQRRFDKIIEIWRSYPKAYMKSCRTIPEFL